MIPVTIVFLSVMVSCKQEEYEKSANGLEYKVIVDNKKPKAKKGEVIKYHVYWRTMKDSMFLSTQQQNVPLFSKVDSPKFQGDPLEILSLAGPGDSLSCRVPVDLIFRGFPPAFLHHGDFMKLDFKVLDVMPESEYNRIMAEKANEQLLNEQKVIQDYMTKNNLQGEKTPDGMYVVMEDAGNGKQPAIGNTVKVNYSGRLLDGTPFDSSLDPGREPFEFTIGKGMVIKGWDEGISYFREGGKGKLIIPSSLGYGERGSPPKIPANSVLVFDIQLLEVK